MEIRLLPFFKKMDKLKFVLKDPNTHWKYLLTVIILAFIIGGGILIYQNWWLYQKKAEVSEVKPIVEKEFVEMSLGELKEGENRIGNLIIDRKPKDSFTVNDAQYVVTLIDSGCGAYQCWSNYELNIKENTSLKPIKNVMWSISDKGGEIYFFEYQNLLYIISSTFWKVSGACIPVESSIIYVVKKDILQNEFNLNETPLLIEKDGKLYLKGIKNYYYEGLCSILEVLKGWEEDWGPFEHIRMGCWCHEISEFPCVDEYYLLENGRLVKSNKEFKKEYLKEVTNYTKMLQEKDWKENDWLSPLIGRTLNLIFAGEEDRAWKEFFEDFTKFSQKYPLKEIEKIDPNKIKQEIQAQLKER